MPLNRAISRFKQDWVAIIFQGVVYAIIVLGLALVLAAAIGDKTEAQTRDDVHVILESSALNREVICLVVNASVRENPDAYTAAEAARLNELCGEFVG